MTDRQPENRGCGKWRRAWAGLAAGGETALGEAGGEGGDADIQVDVAVGRWGSMASSTAMSKAMNWGGEGDRGGLLASRAKLRVARQEEGRDSDCPGGAIVRARPLSGAMPCRVHGVAVLSWLLRARTVVAVGGAQVGGKVVGLVAGDGQSEEVFGQSVG